MKPEKKAINYYSSFYEVSKELNERQFYDFNMAIYKVMFFEIHIDEISFEDKMLTILWKSIKHSIKASIEGYCTKKSIPYDECFAPLSNPLSNPLTNKEKDKEKDKDNEQVQVEDEGCIVTTKSYDDSLRLAEYLYKNILRLNPNHKKPNLNTWAKDIDLAIRIDGRTVEQLKDCIDWIYTPDGAFWQKNILSGKKLREKFDTMNIQNMTKKPSLKEQKLNNLDMLKAKAMQRDGYSEQQIMEAIGR